MDYLVGWYDPKTGKLQEKGSLKVDAKSIYDAKRIFLQISCKGTQLEGTQIMQLISLTRARNEIDRRLKKSLPQDFSIKAFLQQINEEVPV